jgi:clan AA aspartic protease
VNPKEASFMGYVRVKGTVINLTDRSKCAEVEFIADTGAMLTMVPGKMLESLDIRPKGERRFRFANGEVSKLPVGSAYIEIEGEDTAIDIIFGSEEAPPILGVTTLEQLGLEVDPVEGKLKRIELMLL